MMRLHGKPIVWAIALSVLAGCSGKDEAELERATWGWDQAIMYESVKRVKELIASGADVNTRNKDGLTPLAYAIKNKEFEIGLLLIKAGADVNARDKNGCPILHRVAAMGRDKFAQALINAGADVNARDDHGYTPLHYYATKTTWRRGGDGDTDKVVPVLLSAGADINARANAGGEEDHGDTPLLLAVRCVNAEEVISQLLEAGADPNARDDEGNTPLHLEILQCRVLYRDDIITSLLGAGADPTLRNNDGLTPLQVAERDRSFLDEAYRLIKLKQLLGEDGTKNDAPPVPATKGDR